MNPTEAKSAFLSLRANGWSLRSISKEIGVSKSTLFDWESDPGTRRVINSLKSIQIENIQEKFIPSFEEEVEKLSSLLTRVEGALGVQDFYAMRPEFLLRMSVQIRTRLQRLRCDVQPVSAMRDPELPSNPRPGCITRHKPSPPLSLSPTAEESQGEGAIRDTVPGATPDKTEIFSLSGPSIPATCDSANRTPVRSENSPTPTDSENTQPLLPTPSSERCGDLATPSSNLPVHLTTDEIALTAGFDRSGPPMQRDKIAADIT
jgi:hypothetical protein